MNKRKLKTELPEMLFNYFNKKIKGIGLKGDKWGYKSYIFSKGPSIRGSNIPKYISNRIVSINTSGNEAVILYEDNDYVPLAYDGNVWKPSYKLNEKVIFGEEKIKLINVPEMVSKFLDENKFVYDIDELYQIFHVYLDANPEIFNIRAKPKLTAVEILPGEWGITDNNDDVLLFSIKTSGIKKSMFEEKPPIAFALLDKNEKVLGAANVDFNYMTGIVLTYMVKELDKLGGKEYSLYFTRYDKNFEEVPSYIKRKIVSKNIIRSDFSIDTDGDIYNFIKTKDPTLQDRNIIIPSCRWNSKVYKQVNVYKPQK